MDEADRAQQCEEFEREAALREFMSQAEPDEYPDYNDYGQRLCVDCGVIIPQGRVDTLPSVVRCVTCQEVHEHA